ncbi:MAG TPA: hypothetical protein VGC87_02250 [Pyrinomonadaceae bacterium]|jgi:hypothetical protein
MADYNLWGLSTRSFEQLIQAIAVKRIGSTVRIFGDGPDGGREATFEGSVPYPSPEDKWVGYGIIQAKFLQRPLGSGKEGDWALQQLRSELKKFANPKKPRRKPDYYIFATNVVLTPVEEEGSQDKAYELFNEFKNDLPLKGYDIWDYDKLRAFLDGYEDIRRSYAAFITHGDVLAQVIEWLHPKQPDFKQILYSFLQRELLADQYANLEQAGRATEEKIPIARVFVDLPAFGQPGIEPPKNVDEANKLSPGFVENILNRATERFNDQYLDVQTSADDSSLSMPYQEKGRFVLIGGPGQGKSTIGQFICQLFRSAILKDRANWRHPPDVEQVLQLLETQCSSEGIRWPVARRFPFRIVLNEFAKELASSRGRITSVLTFIVERIKKKTDRHLSTEDLRQWLSAYPWLLILDGLDEVPASSNRAEVLEAIRDFRIEAKECNADILIIATSRPQGYNQDFAPSLYQHQWLTPLSPPRALHYARRLAEVRYGSDDDRKEKVLTLLKRASESETTARLMRTPLQVTIMTTLVGMRGQPPQERWSLFNEYYKVIYHREVEREIPASQILRDYKADIDRIHHRVGLILQIKSERMGETDAHLSETDFSDLVAHRLAEEGHEGEELIRLQQQITESAMDRLVFLVGLQDKKVGFEIRSLLEFMAAEALMGSRESVVRDRLREIAPVANWRNVFLFAAGKCFAERQELRDTIHTICAQLNDNEDDELGGAVLEGSLLALDLLEDGLARTQPKYARILARIALRILSLPPDQSSLRLAELYDSSLESVYQEELAQYISLTEPSRRLAAWSCLIPLIEAGIPWAGELGNDRWPVIESERSDLLEVAGNSQGGAWTLSKLINFIPYMNPADLVRYEEEEEELLLELFKTENRPGWLNAISVVIADHYMRPGTHEYNLQLPDTEGAGFAVETFSTTAPIDEWLRPIEEIPDNALQWLPYIVSISFLDNPSNEMLAQALRIIANRLRGTDADLEIIKRNFTHLPWTLSACIRTALSSQDLLDMAVKVEMGMLGDIGDWQAAEMRWRKHGITLADIEYMTDDRYPFDENISRQGFPFAAITSWSLSSYERGALLKALLEVHGKLNASRIRSLIGSWALFTIEGTRKRDLLDGVPTYDQFALLIIDAIEAGRSIGLTILNYFSWETQVSEPWIRLLDRLGRYQNLYAQEGAYDSLITLLSTEFNSNPAYEGLLRILSFFSVNGSQASVLPALLQPERFDEIEFKEAAIVTRLALGSLSPAESEYLAEYIAKLSTEGSYIAGTVMRLIESENLSPAVFEQFLLYLRKRLPSSEWRAISRVRYVLGKILTSRTSSLEEPQVWTRLDLPSGLYHLIDRNTFSHN